MKRLVLIPTVALALAACAGDDDETETDSGSVPDSVVEGVREEFPHTHTDDIAVSYADIKEQDPDATDDQAIVWMVEAIAANEEVAAWNDCLEEHPTGSGCTEPDDELSEENPLGW